MSYPNLGLVPLSCFPNTTFYPFFPFCCMLHIICFYFSAVIVFNCRSQWLRGLGRVYGRSPTAIVGWNSTGGMKVCLLCLLCVVR
jgi:hypothetical protein